MPDHRYALPFQQLLRHFLVERLLGHGGFGLTYLAFDTKLGRRIAIKELLPVDFVIRDEDRHTIVPRSDDCAKDFAWARRRFLEEGRTLAGLHHAAILPIYDFFEENGTAYLITAYIEGENFEDYLKRRGSIGEQELRTFTLTLLDALHLVHANNYLHRDIKPENILMEQARGKFRPIMIDFGNARVTAAGEKTKNLTAVLTKGYAPFEQYTSNSKQGPWTDLYALGAVLFRAITGAPPDDSADRKDEDKVRLLSANPPPGYSREFLRTIDKALRLRREERWQNCEEWMQALGAPRPIDEHAVRKPGTPRRRQPLVAALGALAVLAILVVGVTAALIFSHAQNSLTPVNPTSAPDDSVTSAATPTLAPDPVPTPVPTPQLAISAPTQTPQPSSGNCTDKPQLAELNLPYRNSLGMDFVPVKISRLPGKDKMKPGISNSLKVLFCVHQTRVQDYQEMIPSWKAAVCPWRDCPVVNVNWKEANKFCEWLTEREKSRLGGAKYRLPTDYEWSYATQLVEDPDLNPMKKKSQILDVFPWDDGEVRGLTSNAAITVTHGGSNTVHVMSYVSAKTGLGDMGGNVREWSDTPRNGYKDQVYSNNEFAVRGSSWKIHMNKENLEKLLSSHRDFVQVSTREEDLGFRCVIELPNP